MQFLNNIPVYKASVDAEGAGMFVISIVDDPAVESMFVTFAKETKPLEFKIEDEDQHIVKGVVMRADFPIYRRDKKGDEYYIIYDKETIEKMGQKFLKEGYQENVDINHSFDLIEGIELQQIFISDKENGINPAGFEDIEDHSLFAVYKVTDEELWKQVKEGTFGFSLAGSFLVEETPDPEEEEILSMIERLAAKLRKTKQ